MRSGKSKVILVLSNNHGVVGTESLLVSVGCGRMYFLSKFIIPLDRVNCNAYGSLRWMRILMTIYSAER